MRVNGGHMSCLEDILTLAREVNQKVPVRLNSTLPKSNIYQ